jgi:spore coat protein U-like protein
MAAGAKPPKPRRVGSRCYTARVIRRQPLLCAFLLLALTAAPRRADAQANATCSVSPLALAFGAYDPTAAADLRTQGTITLACSHGNPEVRISISAGNSGSIHQRELRRPGGAAMLYNVYMDAALGTIWGDGTAGVSLKVKNTTAVVYGHVPARQTGLAAGSYTDVLVVTIDY